MATASTRKRTNKKKTTKKNGKAAASKRKVFKVNRERMKEKHRELTRGSIYADIKGETKLRILPPWSDVGDVGVEIWTHFGVGPEKAVVQCPRTPAIDGTCPICQEKTKLRAKGASDDTLRKLSYSRKFLVNALDLKEIEKGVQIFRLPVTVYKKITAVFEDEYYGDITDVDTGNDILVRKEGEGMTTKYDTDIRDERSLSAVLKGSGFTVDEILDQLNDLDAEAAKGVKSYDAIKALFEGSVVPGNEEESEPAESEEEDESEAPESESESEDTEEEVDESESESDDAEEAEDESEDDDDEWESYDDEDESEDES